MLPRNISSTNAGTSRFKKILGTKIHVAAEQNGLPISIVMSPANIHDSAKFIDVMQNISEFLDDDDDEMAEGTVSAYAEKGHDARCIRDYLRCNEMGWLAAFHTGIIPSLLCQKTCKAITAGPGLQWRDSLHGSSVDLEKVIRYERSCENYLGLAYLASIMMYWIVLG